MYYLFVYAAGFISAVIFMVVTSEWRRKKRRRKRTALAPSGETKQNPGKKKIRIDTYVKAATSLVIAHGLAMVTVSYVLAWFGKDSVSDVSVTLITEIVAPLCLYMGTNCIMNIFEKNELSFSKPIQMQKVREAWDKTHEDADETEDAEDAEDAAG